MSDTTSSTAPPNPFAGSVSASTLPTSGSSFGALKYNINEKLGWMLGSPSATDIYLYSDLIFDNNNGYYDLIGNPSQPLFNFMDTTYSDQTLVKAVSTFMTYGDYTVELSTYDPTDYATLFGKSDGIMGISWLPWNVYGLKNSDGNYCVKHYYANQHFKCNPMRKEVLMIKLFSLLKILGITFGTYALFKLTYKLIKHERK